MKLNAREKKIIIIGLCVVAGVLIYYAVTLLLPNSENLSQSVDLKKKMLLKQRETIAREETYKIRLDQYNKQLEKDMTRLLPGNNPNVAGAELQKLLQDFANQSGVEITAKNILPPAKIQDLLIKVSVRVDINCNLEQLVQFLTAIASYDKFLKIDEFNISGYRIQKRFEIRPNLTIAGYINPNLTAAGNMGDKEAKPKAAPANGI